MTFYENGYTKEGMDQKDQSAAKKREVILLEVKRDSHVNGIPENCGDADTAAGLHICSR